MNHTWLKLNRFLITTVIVIAAAMRQPINANRLNPIYVFMFIPDLDKNWRETVEYS